MIRVREMTAAEADEVRQLARSRTEPTRRVERAKMVWQSRQGKCIREIAAELHVCRETVRTWLIRFNHGGIAGLEDAPRPGCPATFTPEQVSVVIETALTKPQDLGLPFSSWTLDRLEAFVNEEKGIAMKRSRIDEILLEEGLRWRKQETWFGERVDPDFAEKRGRSNSCIPLHPRTAS